MKTEQELRDRIESLIIERDSSLEQTERYNLQGMIKGIKLALDDEID